MTDATARISEVPDGARIDRAEPTGEDPRRFPMRRSGCPFDPPPEYARLRADEPVSRAVLGDGQQVWLISRHDDARAILRDPRVSGDLRRPGMPVPGGGPRMPAGVPTPFARKDPPEHTFFRRLLLPHFTVRRIRDLRPRIRQLVDETLETMAGMPQPVDLVEALALPIPSLVICEVLGVPYADHEFFQAQARVFLNRHTTTEQMRATLTTLREYMNGLFAIKRAHPADDLMTQLVRVQAEHDISDADLAITAQALLNAGHETTANMIALGTVVLLEHPDALARLRSDADLWPGAVEELLRYLSIGDLVSPRSTTEDIEIGGTVIPAGDGLFVLNAAANRDADAFEEPDVFDPQRPARHHLAFGYGIHQCLGQNLARAELEIVFEALFARFPDLRVEAAVDDLSYKTEAALYGLHSLPVRW